MTHSPEDYFRAAAFLRVLAGEEHSGQLERIAGLLEWTARELLRLQEETNNLPDES